MENEQMSLYQTLGRSLQEVGDFIYPRNSKEFFEKAEKEFDTLWDYYEGFPLAFQKWYNGKTSLAKQIENGTKYFVDWAVFAHSTLLALQERGL